MRRGRLATALHVWKENIRQPLGPALRVRVHFVQLEPIPANLQRQHRQVALHAWLAHTHLQ